MRYALLLLATACSTPSPVDEGEVELPRGSALFVLDMDPGTWDDVSVDPVAWWPGVAAGWTGEPCTRWILRAHSANLARQDRVPLAQDVWRRLEVAEGAELEVRVHRSAEEGMATVDVRILDHAELSYEGTHEIPMGASLVFIGLGAGRQTSVLLHLGQLSSDAH